MQPLSKISVWHHSHWQQNAEHKSKCSNAVCYTLPKGVVKIVLLLFMSGQSILWTYLIEGKPWGFSAMRCGDMDARGWPGTTLLVPPSPHRFPPRSFTFGTSLSPFFSNCFGSLFALPGLSSLWVLLFVVMYRQCKAQRCTNWCLTKASCGNKSWRIYL